MKKKKNDIGTFFTAPIVISLVIIALIVLMSIFAPIIGPYDPDQMDMRYKDHRLHIFLEQIK